MANSKKWQLVASKIGYNHPFLKVREDHVVLPNGTVIPDYSVWESGQVAQVIPITPEGNYILVEQYKQGIGRTTMEFPGGFIEANEDKLRAAQRELSEETGYQSTDWQELTTIVHHPSKEDGATHLFIAQGVTLLEEKEKLQPDVTEDILVHNLTEQQVLEKILTGEIMQSGTIAGFLLWRGKSSKGGI